MGLPIFRRSLYPLARAQQPSHQPKLRNAGGQGPSNRVTTQQSTRTQGDFQEEGGFACPGPLSERVRQYSQHACLEL